MEPEPPMGALPDLLAWAGTVVAPRQAVEGAHGAAPHSAPTAPGPRVPHSHPPPPLIVLQSPLCTPLHIYPDLPPPPPHDLALWTPSSPQHLPISPRHPPYPIPPPTCQCQAHCPPFPIDPPGPMFPPPPRVPTDPQTPFPCPPYIPFLPSPYPDPISHYLPQTPFSSNDPCPPSPTPPPPVTPGPTSEEEHGAILAKCGGVQSALVCAELGQVWGGCQNGATAPPSRQTPPPYHSPCRAPHTPLCPTCDSALLPHPNPMGSHQCRCWGAQPHEGALLQLPPFCSGSWGQAAPWAHSTVLPPKQPRTCPHIGMQPPAPHPPTPHTALCSPLPQYTPYPTLPAAPHTPPPAP